MDYAHDYMFIYLFAMRQMLNLLMRHAPLPKYSLIHAPFPMRHEPGGKRPYAPCAIHKGAGESHAPCAMRQKK